LFSSGVLRIPYKRVEGLAKSAAFVQLTVRVASADNSAQGVYATCVVDSGAVISVFRDKLARSLGLNLESGERITMSGVGGRVTVWLHDVVLELPGGPVHARVGFQRDLPVMGLLGMDGFFEHFKVTFDGHARVCELERISKRDDR
jgi:hypothetical protein